MTTQRTKYSFTRYLAAKKTVDDRALNRHVWQSLLDALPAPAPGRILRVLEIGAGIGTMVERAWEWGLLAGEVAYTAIDADAGNIVEANRRLPAWAASRGIAATSADEGVVTLAAPGQRTVVTLETIDLYDFIARERGQQTWDLLIAHAFLDLVDIPATLPPLFSLLEPGGMFTFTLNFDGVTALEPVLDPSLDAQIEALYHRTMDERVVGGRRSGDSRSGRHLIHHLRAAGASILDAGSSDWVVFPGPEGYPADEAYFLHFIIHTIQGALNAHPELDAGRFAAWAEQRHAQIEREELVYIAHQIDVVGRAPQPLAGSPGAVIY